MHFVINRLPGEVHTDLLIRDAWQQVTDAGSIDYTTIREQGGYEELAKYLVKQADAETEGQMELFPEEERKQLLSVSCSRNLDRPQAARREYRHWTMRRILEQGPKPTPGYYIDKESIIAGVNPFTGLSYFKYTEIRIQPVGRETWKGARIE